VALQTGLSHADAQEVVQNTFIKVAKNIRNFEYDPNKGKFRNWLCLIAKQQVANLFRKAKPQNNISETEIRRLPDGANEWDAIWNREEEKHLLAIVLARVKTKVNPEQFQIFYAHCIKGMGTKEVAELQDVSANKVYLAKHRVMPIFEDELKQVNKDEDARGLVSGRP
jgi:RNA polymerase sigma-70 factor (ECF subfamily)